MRDHRFAVLAHTLPLSPALSPEYRGEGGKLHAEPRARIKSIPDEWVIAGQFFTCIARMRAIASQISGRCTPFSASANCVSMRP